MAKIVTALLASVVVLVAAGTFDPSLGVGQPSSTTRYVLLTFDDGPDPRYTPQVLSILGQQGIRAVFFIVGSQAEAYLELLRDIVAGGHALGNHTFTHTSINGMTPAEVLEEVRRTDAVVSEITGDLPRWFRPPRGLYTEQNFLTLRQAGKEVVVWDAGLEKEGIKEPEVLVDHLIRRVKGQDRLVLLLHDGDPTGSHDRTATVEALPLLIDKLRRLGYSFVDPSSPQGQEFLLSYAYTHQRYK